MLALSRDRRRLRLTAVLGGVAVFLLLCVRMTGSAATESTPGLQFLGHRRPSSQRKSYKPSSSQTPITDGSMIRPSDSGSPFIGFYGEITSFAPPTTCRPGGSHPLHTELQSVTTSHRKFFRIKFGTEEVINPNIIPHPYLNDTWIVVAQRAGDENAGIDNPSAELVCSARFVDEALTCVDVDAEEGLYADDGHGDQSWFGSVEPMLLPVEATSSEPGSCPDEIRIFSLNVGLHDARVFHGPSSPLILYGSNSHSTCFGQWLQDFRTLVPDIWSSTSDSSGNSDDEQQHILDKSDFSTGTELQRPTPHNAIEKNWFLFWDAAGDAYVQTDLTPRRSFAHLHPDGSVGRGSHDIHPQSAQLDDKCLAQYLPRTPDLDQASNSLAVTLCRRANPECVPDDENTFVFVIVQHRTVFEGHTAYHPYVVVFRHSAPFEVWAVSKRPIWISGRGLFRSGDTEGFSITSMSWRDKGQTYHGYVDDVLFLAFGIEDNEGAAIDVLAGDLLANLGLC